jgi:hypothetical protein
MRLHTFLRKSLFGKSIFRKATLATAALSGLFLFAGAPQAQAADRRDGCERRVAKAQWKLRDAIEDHGYYSRQANHQRHELNEAYERCDRYRGEYRYYDRDDHRRYDRDWDRDRDRY